MRVLSRVVLLALILSLSPILRARSPLCLRRDILVAAPGSGTIRQYSASSRPRRFRQRTQFSLVDYRRSDREHLRVGVRQDQGARFSPTE